jgi:hypothetical protein
MPCPDCNPSGGPDEPPKLPPGFDATCTMYANQLTLVCVTAGRRGLYHAESSPRTRESDCVLPRLLKHGPAG